MIRRISPDSITELAAAQVILDLASATKELLENSIDANASQVTITFHNNGLESFEVQDDGNGIELADMKLLGKRHHTSKLVSDEEIYSIKSFGFRGEALHSIITISEEVTITSKTVDENFGYTLIFRRGQPIVDDPKPVAFAKGTHIKVKGLLSGYPVRQDEWKRNSKRHFSKALWIIQSTALATMNVRVRCLTDKQQIFCATSGSGDAYRTFLELFPGELKGPFKKIKVVHSKCSVDLHIGMISRKSGDRQFCFMNGRPCDLPRILKKINDTLRSRKLVEGFAIILVYLNTSELVDVNLTPDKRQLLFSFEGEVLDEILSALDKELAEVSEIPSSLVTSSITIQSSETKKLSSSQTTPSLNIDDTGHCDSCPQPDNSTKNLQTWPFEASQSCLEETMTIQRSNFLQMEIIGQFNRAFILTKFQSPEDCTTKIFIIDQHAADERFRLERLQMELEVKMQQLLCPALVNLSTEEVRYLLDYPDILSGKSFFKGHILENKVYLLSCPNVMGLQLDQNDFLEMIQLMIIDEWQGLFSLKKVAEILAYKACRSAIMIGDALSSPQMNQLVRNLGTLKKPWICAHGRPTIRLLYTEKS